MADRSKSRVSRAQKPQRIEALGPGLHAAKIEMRGGDAWKVRTLDGRRFDALLGDDVDPSFAEECLRRSRMVLLLEDDRGVVVAGALQTSSSLAVDRDGVLTVDADDLRLRARRHLAIEIANASIRADGDGVVRMEGERLVVDMAAIVKILSARVELP